MFKQHRNSTSRFEPRSCRREKNAQVPAFYFTFFFLFPRFETSHFTIYQGPDIASGERCFILRLLLISSIRKTWKYLLV